MIDKKNWISLQGLGMTLRESIEFRYITADENGVKLWNSAPAYNEHGHFWSGDKDSWRGAISIDAIPNLAHHGNPAENIAMIDRPRDIRA